MGLKLIWKLIKKVIFLENWLWCTTLQEPPRSNAKCLESSTVWIDKPSRTSYKTQRQKKESISVKFCQKWSFWPILIHMKKNNYAILWKKKSSRLASISSIKAKQEIDSTWSQRDTWSPKRNRAPGPSKRSLSINKETISEKSLWWRTPYVKPAWKRQVTAG